MPALHLHDVPGRHRIRRPEEHLLGRLGVLLVLGVVPPVVRLHFPRFERIARHPLQAAFLLRLADVKPELHQHVAVVEELPLESHDVVVREPPLLLGNELLHPFHENPPVPRADEDRHEPSVGNADGVAPEEGTRGIRLGRRADGVHLEAPRIDETHQEIDAAVLAGSVPPFEEHHHGNPRLAAAPLEIVQPVSQRSYQLVELALRDTQGKVRVFEHRCLHASNRGTAAGSGGRFEPQTQMAKESIPRPSEPCKSLTRRNLLVVACPGAGLNPLRREAHRVPLFPFALDRL